MGKSRIKTVGSLIAVSVFSVGLTACGGSDNSSSLSIPSESEHVSITASNSSQVSSTAMIAISGYSDIDDSQASFKVVGSQNGSQLLDFAKLPMNYLNTQKRSKALAKTVSESCSGGGSISADSEDYSGSSFTVSFSNCIEGGTTMNGKISVSESGDTSTATYSNFSLKDSEASVVFNSAKFVTTDTRTSLDLTGYVEVGSERVDYKNYKVEAEQTLLYTYTLSVNGYIKTSCTGKWLNIVTNRDIVISEYDNCPTEGKVTVNGNSSSLSVAYNDDQSVDIYVNGGAAQHYDNCTDVDSGNICQ